MSAGNIVAFEELIHKFPAKEQISALKICEDYGLLYNDETATITIRDAETIPGFVTFEILGATGDIPIGDAGIA